MCLCVVFGQDAVSQCVDGAAVNAMCGSAAIIMVQVVTHMQRMMIYRK